jgi:hypothetical protein
MSRLPHCIVGNHQVRKGRALQRRRCQISRIRRHILLADEDRNTRRTVADALEILRSKVGFDEDNRAQARIGWLKLPSTEAIGLVQVVFDAPGDDTVWVVSLPSSREFHARRPNSSQHSRFDIAGLDGAVIDSAGTVQLTGGASLHAVEIIPAKLPYTPSELDNLIVHRTIAFIPEARERCFRRLRDSVPARFRTMVPDLRFLDCSKLFGLEIPSLESIAAYMIESNPTGRHPSQQKIADALRKFGARVPKPRPRVNGRRVLATIKVG